MNALSTSRLVKEGCLQVVFKIEYCLDEIITPHEGRSLRDMEKLEFDIYNPRFHADSNIKSETFEEVGERVITGVKEIARKAIIAGQCTPVCVPVACVCLLVCLCLLCSHQD